MLSSGHGVGEGAAMKKKKSSRGLLVSAYAEGISANLLEQHGDTVKLVIGRKREVREIFVKGAC